VCFFGTEICFNRMIVKGESIKIFYVLEPQSVACLFDKDLWIVGVCQQNYSKCRKTPTPLFLQGVFEDCQPYLSFGKTKKNFAI